MRSILARQIVQHDTVSPLSQQKSQQLIQYNFPLHVCVQRYPVKSQYVSIFHAEGRYKRFFTTIKREQFRFGGIRVYYPFLAPANNRFQVIKLIRLTIYNVCLCIVSLWLSVHFVSISGVFFLCNVSLQNVANDCSPQLLSIALTEYLPCQVSSIWLHNLFTQASQVGGPLPSCRGPVGFRYSGQLIISEIFCAVIVI